MDPSRFLNLEGLLFLVLGEIAGALAGFSFREIAGAFRHWLRGMGDAHDLRRGAAFFEAAARNALALGALAALFGFVRVFHAADTGGAGLSGFLTGMVREAMPMFYALILAAALGGPASVLGERARRAAASGGSVGDRDRLPPVAQSPAWGAWLGYLVYVALIAWTVHSLISNGLREWQVQWPAWLSVVGGAGLLALLYGDTRKGRGASIGLACAGTLAGVAGMLQSLNGFSTARIDAVAMGIGLALTACVAGLGGMLLLSYPLEDRAGLIDDGSSPCRMVWYGFPFFALSLLVVIAIMVLTPMQAKG